MVRYVPPKIQKCGEELRSHNNTELTLSQLHEMYPKLTSYQSAINKLRAYLIETEEHHPSYSTSIAGIEQELVARYTESLGPDGKAPGDERTLHLIKFLMEFKNIPLRRQINILHKIRLGKMSLGSSEFESRIKSIQLLPDYVSKVVLSTEEQQAAKERTQEALPERRDNVIKLPLPNTQIRKAVTILRSKEEPFENICVALGLLTGRRTIELLSTGSIEAIPGNPYWAYFRGQVKTGLDNITTATEDVERPYLIPLLATFNLVNKKLCEIQAAIKQQFGELAVRETLNQRISYKLSRAVKELIHSEFRFHDLRTLYAMITFEAFKPHSFGLNGWVGRVLGHVGLNMSVHYTRMQIGPVSPIARIVKEFSHQ